MATLLRKRAVHSSSLPLVCVGDLIDGNGANIETTANAIGSAAREFGFFRICNHGISSDLIERTYAAAREFFEKSECEKLRYYIGHSPNHRGYVPFSEKGDYPDEANRNYEAFDLGVDLPQDDPDFLAGCRLLGPNIWPDLSGFRQTVSHYFSVVSALGKQICSALELYLDLPAGTMTNQMTKPISQLRLLHYVRRLETVSHKSVNMGAHTDYECLTLLHTCNDGLQIMLQNGRWINVPVDPAVLVVNIGDMLEAWSNGLLRSTPHRVLNRSPERFSLPYFLAANYETMIAPFPQLVNADRPAQYQPFRAGAHLERMLVRDFPYLRELRRRQAMVSGAIFEESVLNPFENRLNQSIG